MSDAIMNGIETDKRTEIFSMRIPSITKALIEGLSPTDKTRLNDSILMTIAKCLHEAKFDPRLYLKESIG